MKLVITQSNLTLKGGGERVLLKIAQRYKAKIYTAEYDSENTFPEFKDMDVEVVGRRGVSKVIPYGRVAQGINYGLTFYNFKIKEDYDVINPHFAPSHWIRHMNERVLWYCHTPLRDVWDLYQYRLGLKKLHQKPVHILGAKVVRRLDRGVVKDIESILANSENTRSRLIKYFGRDDARVLNGGVEYERYKNNGDDSFFFYPSRMSPNKQQDFAVEAFVRFKRMMGERGAKYRLVLCGVVSLDRFYKDYYEKVQRLAARAQGVEILTQVSDEKLLDLYSRCTAVLYPPINEDYGLVPLEAMASGKPVIARNEGGPRETVVEDRTGFLVNDAEHMARKMLYIAEHPSEAREMGEAGIKRIRTHYNWDRFFEVFEKELDAVKKKG
jgi:glycosyltransferase involved in cell wall biosynthesis